MSRSNIVNRKGKREKRREHLTKRNLAFVTIAVIALWLVIAWEIPDESYGLLAWPYHENFTDMGYTYLLNLNVSAQDNLTNIYGPIEYNANFTFNSVLGFSVGVENPIEMTAYVYNVSLPDSLFNLFYEGIIFEWQSIVTANPAGQHAQVGFLNEISPGVWKATETIIFSSPINFTGLILWPRSFAGLRINLTYVYNTYASQIKSYHFPNIDLQPESFSVNVYTMESSLKFGIMAAAISPAFIYGLVVRAVLDKDE